MKKLFKVSFMVFLMAFSLSVPLPVIGTVITPQVAIAATSKEPKVTASSVTLYVGYKTYQIKYENLSKNAALTFKSSNTKIAKVSTAGIITPIAQGSATVTVTIKQNSKTYTSKIKVTVDLSNIKFTAKKNEFNIGDKYTFKAKAYGTVSKIVWTVSDKSVAKINGSTGELTALSEGETDVIATAGAISSRYTVNVVKNKFSVESTDLQIYDQTIIDINISESTAGENIYFSVGNESIITCQWGEWVDDVSPLLINPKKKGSTTITITSDSGSDKLVINVTVVDAPKGREPDAKELSAKEIYAECAPSTVELGVTTADGDYIGSGFFIQSGVIVTNYHVIDGATKITVTTYNGKIYDAVDILAYDKDYDLALLTIDAVTDHLQLNKGDVTVGETVYALGSPRGLTGSLSNGIISSASRVLDGVNYIQITAPISPGNSGGPLINSYGEVIGINTFILLDSQNLNFAINIDEADKLKLNASVSAADFYKANAEPKDLYEDETKSGNTGTLQLVKNDTYVHGSLHASNYIDGYKISLSEARTFTATGLFGDNGSAYNYTYFTLVDTDGNVIADSTSEAYEDSMFRDITADLKAGDYYLLVYYDSDLGTTTNYIFYVQY